VSLLGNGISRLSILFGIKLKHVVTIIALAFLFSFITGGFVLPIGAAAEWWASTALISKLLLVLGLLIFFGIVYVGYRSIKTANELEKSDIPREIKLKKMKSGGTAKMVVLFILALIILGVLGGIQGMFIASASGGALMSSSEKLDKPIPVVMTRIIPLKTAYATALSILKTPTHTIYWEDTSIYYKGNRAVFGWIVEPEGNINSLIMEPLGAILFDGSDYPFNKTFIEKKLYWGLHNQRITPLFIDNLLRHIKLECIWCKPLYSDLLITPIKDRIYLLIPLEGWFTGFDTSIPYLAGFAVISEDGSIRFVPSDSMKKDPVVSQVLKKYRIPIVPEVVAREWVETMRWAPGIVATAILHNTFEIRDIGANPQPYLVYDDSGNLWWLFVAEPSGESYAVKYIIYVNASSPTPDIRIYEPKEQLIGPSRIANYVMKAHPTFDWSLFELAEPIPIIINGTLYWKVTIITSDGRGVVSIDLVDARTGTVNSIPIKEGLTAEEFLAKAYESVSASNQTGGTTVLEQIRKLKQRVQALINELQAILDELEKLEESVSG
jgi:hypothetical protein